MLHSAPDKVGWLVVSSPGRSPGRAIVLASATASAKSFTLKFFM